MAKRDYYETLGLARNSSEGEIKKAYRRLAMECHPDRNPGDTDAEKRFKELSEAYGILKDDEKRAAYDQFGHAAFDGASGGPGGGFGFTASSFADVFDDLFGDFVGDEVTPVPILGPIFATISRYRLKNPTTAKAPQFARLARQHAKSAAVVGQRKVQRLLLVTRAKVLGRCGRNKDSLPSSGLALIAKVSAKLLKMCVLNAAVEAG